MTEANIAMVTEAISSRVGLVTTSWPTRMRATISCMIDGDRGSHQPWMARPTQGALEELMIRRRHLFARKYYIILIIIYLISVSRSS